MVGESETLEQKKSRQAEEREARDKVKAHEKEITALKKLVDQLRGTRDAGDKAKIKRAVNDAMAAIPKFCEESDELPFTQWLAEVVVVVNAYAQDEEFGARMLPLLLGGTARLEWDRLTKAQKTDWKQFDGPRVLPFRRRNMDTTDETVGAELDVSQEQSESVQLEEEEDTENKMEQQAEPQQQAEQQPEPQQAVRQSARIAGRRVLVW